MLVFFAFVSTGIPAQQKDEDAVAAVTESLRKGLMGKDKALLDQISSSALSYGHSSGLVEDKNTFINAVLTGPVSFAAIDVSGQTVQIQNDIAVVRHVWNAKLIDNGNPRDLKLHVLLIWKKEKKEWKLIARQGFKL